MHARLAPKALPAVTVPRGVFLFLVALWTGLMTSASVMAQVDLGLPGFPDTPMTAGPGMGGKLATVHAHANFQQVQPGQRLVVAVVLDIDTGSRGVGLCWRVSNMERDRLGIS